MAKPLFGSRTAFAAMLIIGCLAQQTNAAIIAYYPFNGATSGVTPDFSGNGNDLTLGGTAPATITSGGVFGNTLTSTASGFAQRVATDSDFNTTFSQLSVSLWMSTDSATLFNMSSATERFLSGKYSTGDNRGWRLNIVGGGTGLPSQIKFGGYVSTPASSANQHLQTTFSTALVAGDFYHVAATFEGSGSSGSMNIYVNGILEATAPSTIAVLNGNNINNFQVGNRGNTATTLGLPGKIDDYLIASNTIAAQEIALIHGLGRMAGVSLGDLNDTLTNTQILDVLAAYNSQGSAVAGTGAAAGTVWYYHPNVAGGPIGTIGGSVANGDAFIQLNSNGSGVSMIAIPEPSSMILIGMASFGLIAVARRRHPRV